MPNDLPELESILHSGALAYGKYGMEFERLVGEFIGNKQVVSVSSYNSAVLIALLMMGIQPGDEIISSPMSCLASNQPLVTSGAKLIWADIDPATGTLDPESVRSKITPSTKAIFHNHHCGYVGYIDEVNAIAKEHGLFIIDDCIEAFGAEYKGQVMGNVGSDITLFSFQTVRLPNTIDGGAIAFKDKNLYERAKMARDYGADRSTFRDKRNEIDPTSDITMRAYGALMNEVNAYIGCCQMKDISALLQKQRYNAEMWYKRIKEQQWAVQPLKLVEGSKPNYWVFSTTCKNRTEELEKFRALGYYASGVHISNNHYSVFGSSNNAELKGVSEFTNAHLALPCGWWVEINL